MGKKHSTVDEMTPALSCAAVGVLRKAACGLFCLGLLGMAAQVATAEPISISKTKDLHFGRYASSVNQGGTVTIDAATGSKVVTGGVSDFGDPHERSQFEVQGDPFAGFSITLPSQLTLTASSGSMTVNAFTSSPSGSGVLGNDGKALFWVGATLVLSASQSADQYGGTFSVSVDYN